jgi:hypothetical protein
MIFAMLRSSCIVLALLTATSTAAIPQGPSPAEQLKAARASYYTPTASGLSGFHCGMTSNWQAMLTRITGSEVPADNPFLVYLNSVSMSVDDKIRGKGSLTWKDTSPPPASVATAANQFRDAVVGMLGGFYQAWNEFMNGGMVPEPDKDTALTRVENGLHLHASSDGTVVDEDFDNHILLTEAHVVSSDLDIVMHPIYTETSDGKIISSLQSVYRTSPTAPPTDLTMTITYSQVSGFRLPATLVVDE